MPSEILEIQMDDLDKKINEFFDGKVVRKDLLHRIKKGTNIPTFVLEFLLARYCASNDPTEIEAGMEAVLATLNENYVRPDEANAAQSRVAQNGNHRFIDKVHVKYVHLLVATPPCKGNLAPVRTPAGAHASVWLVDWTCGEPNPPTALGTPEAVSCPDAPTESPPPIPPVSPCPARGPATVRPTTSPPTKAPTSCPCP